MIVANNIARQIEGKISYRRAIKMAIASTMRMGAEGIKCQVSGGWAALKWPVPKFSRKEGFRFIHSGPTLTMPWAKHLPK